MTSTIHDRLPCGIEYGVAHLPGRHVVSLQIMILAGTCSEPEKKLGLARVLAETLDKGTEAFSGRALSDEFDIIGTSQRVGAGRETTTISTTVLPEHFDRALELCAETIRRPTFPADSVDVNVELGRQELIALEDDPQSLLDKIIGPLAFGTPLGRHSLGEKATLDTITRDDVVAHWQANFCGGRMIVAVAGAVEPRRVAEALERHFGGFGPSKAAGRAAFEATFGPGTTHVHKELEQEQIGICWPGVPMTHDDFPTQQIVLGILSGGMGARLFVEVREKLGLVYWVSAWQDAPRGTGMIFLGASTTPERCDQTYSTLLREVDRLSEDIEEEELQRAITGIVANSETRGESTRSHCGELANDLFHYGRPIPREEKLAKVRGVSIADVKQYLARYPREPRCVVTLGPKPLTA